MAESSKFSLRHLLKRPKFPNPPTLSSASQDAGAENQAGGDGRARNNVTATTRPAEAKHNRLQLFPGGQTLGLRAVYNPPDPLVDIIFIHGLGGDAYNTWLDESSGTYWPVDLLRQSFPKARIMAFGYDADFARAPWIAIGQNNLRGHADMLLGRIARMRPARDGSNRRKIIIVAHSLGGLVAKKAYCLSSTKADTHLQQLHQQMIGILFLGTPHHGSDLASLGQRLSRLYNVGVSWSANPDILETLKRDSQVLEEVENEFAGWLRQNTHFGCTSFYEELEEGPIGKVVTKESATISGYPPYGIHATHRNMAKFCSSENESYQDICGEIERWMENVAEQHG